MQDNMSTTLKEHSVQNILSPTYGLHTHTFFITDTIMLTVSQTPTLYLHHLNPPNLYLRSTTVLLDEGMCYKMKVRNHYMKWCV